MFKTTSIISNIELIKYPVITDKSTGLIDNNQYTFIVDAKATKQQIKTILEFLFNVTIIKVNTCHLPKKKRRVGRFIGMRPHYKKAVVKLMKGQKIDLFSQT